MWQCCLDGLQAEAMNVMLSLLAWGPRHHLGAREKCLIESEAAS